MSKELSKQKLLIGWGSRDVTPERAASLIGQFHVRISTKVRDPLYTTALALESEDRRNQAIVVSLDAASASANVLNGCRRLLNNKLESFDSDKLFIHATHTHTGPAQLNYVWGTPNLPGVDIVSDEEYSAFLVEKITEAAIEAWVSRQPGSLSWGRGHAVIGFNRRTAYFDGSTRMYGKTNEVDFSHIEGHEDHGVELLFIYSGDQNLTGMVVNVPCPSQCTEGACFVSADYWHETREEIRKRHGEGIFILPQCSAAGDISPRTLVNRDADTRMLKLKGYGDEYDPARRRDIAVKIAAAVDEVLPLVKQDIRDSVEFAHEVIRLELPLRSATKEDLDTAEKEIVKWKTKLEELKDSDPASFEYSSASRRVAFNQQVVDAHRAHTAGKNTMPVELHILRIGEVAMATNRFEYYLDFGQRIKARSDALQTFVIQLAGDGGYLPTLRSLEGGSYGASIASTPVGPDGGQIIVEECVAAINGMF